LRRIRGWPDLTKFYGKLKVKLRKAGQTPFRVNVEGESGTLDEVFGRVSGSELFESVFWMLNAVAVPPTTYQFHYRRTVNRLGNLELHRAQGLMGMIRELASLQDAHAGHASYGLLDFLVRLTQVKELTEKVDQWLTANASNEASTVQGLREDLRDENLALVLLVELDNDPGGEITAFQPYLRTQNLALVTREHLAIIRGELG